jgi:hypothetical protein
MTAPMVLFMSGMLAAGYLVAAGFFFKFWRQTRDQLFVYFALAFAILAAQRTLLISQFSLFENHTWAYVARLAAFLLIAYAIVVKNRERPR